MEYQGKLYGKVGKSYFPMELTTQDVDDLELKVKEYEDKIRWIPVEEKHPETYNCQMSFRHETLKYIDIRFIHHENHFNLLCKIHKYTHWRNIL